MINIMLQIHIMQEFDYELILQPMSSADRVRMTEYWFSSDNT